MEISRRQVLAGLAAAPVASLLDTPTAVARPAAVPEVKLSWLEGRPNTAAVTTWGTPWPKGSVNPDQTFALTAADGSAVPVQSWPTAYWPDGSLKWSAHAIAADAPAHSYTLAAGTAAAPAKAVTVKDEKQYVDIDTGVIKARIRKDGTDLISQVWRGGVEIARKGRLVNLQQDKIAEDEEATIARDRFESDITSVKVEQAGPVRAVVRIEGKHTERARAGRGCRSPCGCTSTPAAENVRMVHTFVFDRDGQRDFIAGLGVRFRVPMRDATYDRHVRFAGAERRRCSPRRCKGITGLRRDPGAAVRGRAGRRARSCRTRRPGTSGSPRGCSTSRRGATTR